MDVVWPVVACLGECGHFKLYPAVENAEGDLLERGGPPVAGQLVRCEECRLPRVVLAVGKVV